MPGKNLRCIFPFFFPSMKVFFLKYENYFFFHFFNLKMQFYFLIPINFKWCKILFKSNFVDFIVPNLYRLIFSKSPDGVNDCFRNVTAVKSKKRNFNFPRQLILFGKSNQIAITDKFYSSVFSFLCCGIIPLSLFYVYWIYYKMRDFFLFEFLVLL